MKKKLSERVLVELGERLVKRRVNSCCMWYYYQAKLPKGAEKYKKK